MLYKSYEEGRVALARPVTAGGAAAGTQRLKEWIGSHLRPAMVALDPADDQQLSELYNHNFMKCLLLLPPAPPAPEVSFQWKNPDFLIRNPDFLFRNPDFLLKNVESNSRRRRCSSRSAVPYRSTARRCSRISSALGTTKGSLTFCSWRAWIFQR